MSKKALISLRSKPKRPKRRKIEDEIELYGGEKLVEAVESLGAPLDQIFVKTECRYYDEPQRTLLCVSRMQTDEEYAQDLVAYGERKARYEKWYKENEETILAEIARRKEEAEERKRRVMESERNRLEKELQKLDRHLRK
jgi:hypothetical protein